ncbi:MAG: pyridoxal phosphate-dependent aminotransferase [Rhodospirillales bacterium]|nr:pyridoxal phosphate-dependent aminotransferase [Rhodospirillales bacterium]
MRIRPAVVNLDHSLIREISDAHMGRDNLIALWFGEPDTPTPDFIKQAAMLALYDDHVFYAQNRGIPQLRQAISDYVSALHQRPIGIDRLTVTGSGMNAIMLATQALIDQGDNMVVVGPVWPNCRETVHVMGGETRVISLHVDEGGRWSLDLDELLAACDDRTRGIFVNSPGNPTGWVMPRAQQEELLIAARERGVFIVADEVYVRLAYDMAHAPSFLDVADDDDALIVINSFSKSWSMTGWRLGWLTHSAALGDVFAKLNEFNIASPTTFVQHAGVVAITEGEEFVLSLVENYRRNRDLVFQRLAAMKRVRLSRPEAAFYAFFSVDGMTDSVAFAHDLIEKTGVGLAPGLAFGPEGEGWMRLCFAAEPDTLSRAMDRLEPALS